MSKRFDATRDCRGKHRTFRKIVTILRRLPYRFFISTTERGAVVLALQQRQLRLYRSGRAHARSQTCAVRDNSIAELTYLCRDTVNEFGDKVRLK